MKYWPWFQKLCSYPWGNLCISAKDGKCYPISHLLSTLVLPIKTQLITIVSCSYFYLIFVNRNMKYWPWFQKLCSYPWGNLCILAKDGKCYPISHLLNTLVLPIKTQLITIVSCSYFYLIFVKRIMKFGILTMISKFLLISMGKPMYFGKRREMLS